MPSSTVTTMTTSSMGITHFTKTQLAIAEEDKLSQECKELLQTLPREKGWRTPYLYFFQGFWCQPKEIQAIMAFQKHFKVRDDDIILATIPKSGTTWLKALSFSIINRKKFPANLKNHPLFTSNPHDLVPFFEYKLYVDSQIPDLDNLSHDEPRVFATHVPYGSLQESIKRSNAKIVYICRNPFDTFISSWHFINKLRPETSAPFSIEEAFNMYCNGVVGFGPFWVHMLGYWNENSKRPDNVLFLKYEDMKEDIVSNLKVLASFMGYPFSEEEENEGVIEEIAKLCSFDNLKELEVNKSGRSIKNFKNEYLFRKGKVGDWVNYLSPSMVDQLSQLMEDKLGGSGLTFKLHS